MEDVAAAVPTRREVMAKFIFVVIMESGIVSCFVICFCRGRIQRVAAGRLIAAP